MTLGTDQQQRIADAVAALPERFTLADVGGRWGPPVGWRDLVPPVRVVSFDADEAECRRLQAELDPAGRDLMFAPVALGAHDGEATLYVTRDPACSSLYAPIPEVIAVFPELKVTTLVREERIRVRTLDRWCQEHDETVHAMKLDVQGAELDVLRGAGDVLDSVVVLELEVSFNRIYARQPLFRDVDGFLAERGFHVWRLGHLVHYSRGRAGGEAPHREVAWFDSRPVEFVGGGGELFWAHVWYVAADVLGASTRERRLRAAFAAAAFGLPDLSAELAAALQAAGDLEPLTMSSAARCDPVRRVVGRVSRAVGVRFGDDPPALAPPTSAPDASARQSPSKADRENLDRMAALDCVDLTEHNRDLCPPTFSPLVSQAPTAAQFSHTDYVRWAELLGFAEAGQLVVRGTTPTVFNRKVWEWAFILQAARQYGLLAPGRRAVGFGVGNEPIPAALVRHGVIVVATDQDVTETEEFAATGQWSSTGQLLTGMEGLLRPAIARDSEMQSHVSIRRVDMNAVPEDLGPCDITWSSCALEHLGSPERGFEFVLASARLLAPGGIAVHTTELELTGRESTADWGHLACYRPADLRALQRRVIDAGFDMPMNLHIAMDTPEDLWVSVVLKQGPELAAGERSHLKVAIFDSVCTSLGIIIHRPPTAG